MSETSGQGPQEPRGVPKRPVAFTIALASFCLWTLWLVYMAFGLVIG
ncbi:MAG: hypothetical protein MK106_08810 [Mariniblastus sp.]|nr:hypothetical protein [Mariniblastus sp.]